MADLHCLRCGEPWDIQSVLHEFSEEEKNDFFGEKGCPVCRNKEQPLRSILSESQQEQIRGMRSLSGDDFDSMAVIEEEIVYPYDKEDEEYE